MNYKPLEISPNSKNGSKVMLSNRDNKFVLYYAPWCGHCQDFMPTWNMMCRKVNKMNHELDVKLVKVDCVFVRNQEEKMLGHKPDIMGFPTMRAYKRNSNESSEYQDGRHPEAILNFLKQNFAKSSSSHSSSHSPSHSPSPSPKVKKNKSTKVKKNKGRKKSKRGQK